MSARAFYLHLPKTGGVSVRNALSETSLRVLRYGLREDETLDTHRTDEYDVLAGHYFPCVTLTETRRHVDVLATMVRHPVARVYSLYRYALRKKHAVSDLAHRGLEAFIASSHPAIHNRQATSLLEGLLGDGSWTDTGLPACWVASQAVFVLHQFDIVGIAERHADFLAALGKSLNVKLATRHDNVWRTAAAEELTPAYKREILSRNQADVALWRAASQLASTGPAR